MLRKELAPNFDSKAPLAERVRLLRARTIAVDAIGSILHGYPLLLAKRAGFDPNEIRISPMAPPTVLAAFQARQIDGYAMSMPWPIAITFSDDSGNEPRATLTTRFDRRSESRSRRPGFQCVNHSRIGTRRARATGAPTTASSGIM